MTWVAGADGCKGGWVLVARNVRTGGVHLRVVRTFAELLRLPETPRVLAVDVPIGLPEHASRGGRACDRAARELLGWPRRNSVFSPPVRSCLRTSDYAAAVAASRASSAEGIGISKQAYGILGKIRETDVAMTRSHQSHVKECHPELSFAAMNGGRALPDGKKSAGGQTARFALLRVNGFPDPRVAAARIASRDAGFDDVLDAYACCWTAQRILDGTAQRLPSRTERDPHGLAMEIWY